ncbi:MAG: CdaR family protein [Fimbriimonadales bacterium]|nr:CdaR family protein [Fimbriimonadales bacterium]
MRRLTSNWPIKLASLFVAVLLWFHVQEQTTNVERETYSVQLSAVNLPPDLVVTSMPKSVRVTCEATRPALESIDPTRLVAEVDLGSAQPGRNQLVPQLRQPLNIRAKWEVRDPVVTVEIERLMSSNHPVEIDTSGSPPSDLIYLSSTVDPETVSVVGPVSKVREVRRVRAVLNLSRVRPATSYLLRLEALGPDGKPLGQVRTEPSEVSVRPALAPALAPRSVSVTPRWTGTPAFGFRLVAVTADPSQVALTGKSEVLSGLASVETEPIDLDGIDANRVFRVRLRLPQGVTTATPIVEVSVRVERIPEAGGGSQAP